MAYRGQQSPHRNRRKNRPADPHRMSTGSLAVGPDGYYAGPPPAVPTAPPAPYHNMPYSTPHSPKSSNDSMGDYTGHPSGFMHHPQHPHHSPALPLAPAPAPPAPGMRGGDGGHMRTGIGRRNTQHGYRPNVIHQGQEFEFDSRPPFRGAPVVPRGSRSSSRNREFDLSPPGSAGGSSNFSGGSFDPVDRAKSYVLPFDSRRQGGREYRLNGPLPGEREHRGGGTIYNPAGGNRPVLGADNRPRERSMSRSTHGLGLSSASGDCMSDGCYEEPQSFDTRSNGRRAVNPGALVRSRSRSVPAQESRAMVTQHHHTTSESDGSSSSSSSSTAPPAGTGIRLEYGGNSVDITCTSTGGKPMSIGSITINTTARTTTVPLNSPPATHAIMAPTTQAITAPPPAPAIAQNPPALPAPPPVQAVMIPPPPPPAPQTVLPPGVEPLILPPPPAPSMPGFGPPRGLAGNGSGVYINGHEQERVHESLYRNMEALALEPTRYHDERGRDREIMPPTGTRALSRRHRSQSRSRKSMDNEPRWTKISRDIVARRAVEVKGYDFEEQVDSVVIFQVLREDEIDELIELSERIRSGEVRVIRRDHTPDHDREHRRSRRRQSQHRHGRNSRPQSIHGYPGPSANRPPPAKPALVVPTAPDPPPVPSDTPTPSSTEAPGPPPPPPPPKRPMENPNMPGTYIGYSRNPPRSAAGSGPYYRHVKGSGGN